MSSLVETVHFLEGVFDRPKDIQDIKAMLLAQQGRLDVAQVREEAAQLLTAQGRSEPEALLAAYSG